MHGHRRMKPFRRARRKGHVPRFSVLIPTCNRPAFLAEAIASVLQQDADFELLVVNDDDPLQALPADSRIRHLENARRGAIAARNFGLSMARGEVIAWLDDDDLWCDAHHLARADAALRAGADFTFSDGVMRFADGTPEQAFTQDADAASLARDNTILISGVCYERRLHDALGPFDAALPYYADWDWHLRVARAGHRLARIASPGVLIRIHGRNATASDTLPAREANLAAFAAKHALGALTLKTHADFL